MDKFFYYVFGKLDSLASCIDRLFESKLKKKRKKKKCKNCHCGCHCKDDLHSHHYDGDLCTCSICKC